MACQALASADDGSIILSNYSVVEDTIVQVGCRMFGRRLTSGDTNVKCASNIWVGYASGNAATTTFKCEWNGSLNMYEKLIIGLGSAGGGLLIFGFLLICCLALMCKNKRDIESETESYPPSQINEKVGYAQYHGNGGYNSGGGSGMKGHRPSGKYEKQITQDSRNDYPRLPDSGKRDPYLWSGYNANHHTREPERPDTSTGYQFYSGKPSSQHDNRAFDRNENDRYRETGYHGTNYQQGKREDYRWNGQLPRAHMGRDRPY